MEHVCRPVWSIAAKLYCSRMGVLEVVLEVLMGHVNQALANECSPFVSVVDWPDPLLWEFGQGYQSSASKMGSVLCWQVSSGYWSE